MKLAESFSPITNKLDEVKEYTQKVGDIIRESNSENNQEILPSENNNNIQTILKSLPNSSNFSISMQQMLGSIKNSRNSLKIT